MFADEHVSGPLFDGRAEAALVSFESHAVEEVAQRGVDLVHAELSRVLRHPTGYYESRVQVERATAGARVTDGGVVYGPWLEGVGSRNKSTRFKGYAAFRTSWARLEGEAGDVAERVLPPFLAEMNGGR